MYKCGYCLEGWDSLFYSWQGGKWAVAVSKDISRDMFEELCLYVMDERLGYLADGVLPAQHGEFPYALVVDRLRIRCP